MEEQLVSFKTAKLAKEKGFELNSCSYYELLKEGQLRWKFIDEEDDSGTWVNEDPKNRIAAPTQSLLQKWLREAHNIYIEIEHWHNEKEGFVKCGYKVYTKHKNTGPYIYNNKIITYEDVLEKGLQEALKLI